MHEYEFLPFVNNKAFIYKDYVFDKNSHRICINSQGDVLFELPKGVKCFSYEDEDVLFASNEKGLYALIDNNGNNLTGYIYDVILGGMEEGFFEVKRDGKHGHIDICGNEVIPCIYEDGAFFSEGIAPEKLNNKWGCIDSKNNIIIPFEYEDLSVCSNNRICAKKNGLLGWINKNNDVIVDFKYQDLVSYASRYCNAFPAKINNKWGLIDKTGSVVENFVYDEFEYCSETGRYYAFKKKKHFALYDTVKLNFLTDFIYNEIGDFSYNHFRIKKNRKYGYIDIFGEIIVEPIYQDAEEYFSEGIAIVKLKNKYGAINTSGNVVIPFEYKSLFTSHDGMLLARKNLKEGFIDRKNNIIIPFGKFSCFPKSFSNGFVNVWTMKDGDFYINRKGEKLEIKL